MSLLAAPPVAETALVVSSGVPPQKEELPVDLMQVPSIPLQKTLLLLTNFCTNTVRFINHFSSLCEERLATTSKNLTRLEISLAILEAKLNSIPDLPSTVTPAADLPADLNLPPTEPAPLAPSPSFLKLKDDPMFEKYFKMLKLGMPEGVVRHKLAMDGITLDILSLDPEGPSPNGGTAAPVADEEEDDDDF
ncbi:hypothetical protein DYB37_010310 [Aphanomyces astaci]|uniref:WASH complex subunit 3 n=1 Tax=Aphanomyces astaci TaxID=112090 RepID=A0A3R6YE75_APHAT|nr:hypothetical protein DYB37_010310 [Aphanomyces astaci]